MMVEEEGDATRVCDLAQPVSKQTIAKAVLPSRWLIQIVT